MSECHGRCKCHAGDWVTLDSLAGIPPKTGHGGRKPYETDPAAFRAKLAQHYREEEEAEPDKDPSLIRVAKRFPMDRRTLRRAIDRLGAEWPPDRRHLPGSGKTHSWVRAMLRRRGYAA